MIRNLFGGAVSSTLNVVDIFGDGSGKALWRFENNVLDDSGNFHGTATAITYVADKFSLGASFNGTTSKVAIPNLGFTSLNYTVSAWAKFTNSTDYETVFMHYTGMMCQLYWDSALNQIKFAVYDNGGWQAIYYTTPALNTQYHLVLSVGGGVLTAYVNNTLISTVSGIGTLNNVAGGSYIGMYQDGVNYSMSGTIDHVRILNRAVTAGEVSTLFNES